MLELLISALLSLLIDLDFSLSSPTIILQTFEKLQSTRFWVIEMCHKSCFGQCINAINPTLVAVQFINLAGNCLNRRTIQSRATKNLHVLNCDFSKSAAFDGFLLMRFTFHNYFAMIFSLQAHVYYKFYVFKCLRCKITLGFNMFQFYFHFSLNRV